MTLQERITSFSKLATRIEELSDEEFSALATQVENQNSWFTPEQTKHCLNGISHFLDEATLKDWLNGYSIPDNIHSKSIGLLMAGNIPAVGFHDFMCILLSGHEVHAKLSSSDQVLIKWLARELINIHPEFGSKIFFEDMLKGKEAYIATGSDNSARYFNYYFGKFPSIIRKNRTSIGILEGGEQKGDFQALAHDIFQYFGLGCRNVSKLYIKNKEQLQDFLKAIEGFHFLLGHHKYLNNYEYNKSIYLVNGESHLDNGFLLLKESEGLVSPISVLYYEYYSDLGDLRVQLQSQSQKIQCIVSKNGWYPQSVDFGKAQYPSVDDYADHVDTMEFLTNL
ncbi:MAG: acyl-CoA reductase [Anditalea sp.]